MARSIFPSVLRLHFAGFAAGPAVPLSIFAEADFIQALAEPAVFVARAAALRLIADPAGEFLGHRREISANPAGEQ